MRYIHNHNSAMKRKDEANFNGDCRTKRIILEIYDALAGWMQIGKQYRTRLDPPPAHPPCNHRPQDRP